MWDYMLDGLSYSAYLQWNIMAQLHFEQRYLFIKPLSFWLLADELKTFSFSIDRETSHLLRWDLPTLQLSIETPVGNNTWQTLHDLADRARSYGSLRQPHFHLSSSTTTTAVPQNSKFFSKTLYIISFCWLCRAISHVSRILRILQTTRSSYVSYCAPPNQKPDFNSQTFA